MIVFEKKQRVYKEPAYTPCAGVPVDPVSGVGVPRSEHPSGGWSNNCVCKNCTAIADNLYTNRVDLDMYIQREENYSVIHVLKHGADNSHCHQCKVPFVTAVVANELQGGGWTAHTGPLPFVGTCPRCLAKEAKRSAKSNARHEKDETTKRVRAGLEPLPTRDRIIKAVDYVASGEPLPVLQWGDAEAQQTLELGRFYTYFDNASHPNEYGVLRIVADDNGTPIARLDASVWRNKAPYVTTELQALLAKYIVTPAYDAPSRLVEGVYPSFDDKELYPRWNYTVDTALGKLTRSQLGALTGLINTGMSSGTAGIRSFYLLKLAKHLG